jgi:hypothetical protein
LVLRSVSVGLFNRTKYTVTKKVVGVFVPFRAYFMHFISLEFCFDLNDTNPKNQNFNIIQDKRYILR